MQRPHFFIGREVNEDTLELLRSLQRTVKESAEGFVMTQRPHLTHAGSKIIVQKALGLDPRSLNEIIFPLPKSAADELTLGVAGLKSIKGRRQKPYLFIDLEDPRGKFRNEQRQIVTRVRQGLGLNISSGNFVPPHVTLGKVFPDKLDTELVSRIEACLPASITFLPVSYPVYTTDFPEIVYSDDQEEDQTALDLPPIRKIPKAFLDSLRRRS